MQGPRATLTFTETAVREGGPALCLQSRFRRQALPSRPVPHPGCPLIVHTTPGSLPLRRTAEAIGPVTSHSPALCSVSQVGGKPRVTAQPKHRCPPKLRDLGAPAVGDPRLLLGPTQPDWGPRLVGALSPEQHPTEATA